MEVVKHLGGGAPYLQKYQVAADSLTAGVPKLVSAAGGAGVAVATTTSLVDMVGITLDTATYLTAQQTGNADPEATVTMSIRPDAVVQANLSGGATSGTALTQYDVTTAATDGLSVTTGDDWSSPEMDEGTIWGYDGANAGIVRRITSTSTTAATVTVAFPFDTAVGDNFLRAGISTMGLQTIQLSTTLDEIDASAAVAVNTGEGMVIEIIANDISAEGTLTSKALWVATDHILSNS